ncbi:hypothetical protein ABZ413_29490 [Nocardia rhamnosiphila]|uniref:hypothetical protein n=1 Tax=Nocardia rhamnosiphila TaxID=426716 RepID=UPI0033F42603
MTTALAGLGLNADTDWADIDLPILHRLFTGLRPREMPREMPPECLYTDPIRDASHANHVMDLHRGHNCARWDMAAAYAAVFAS